jgi:hypothetical protein
MRVTVNIDFTGEELRTYAEDIGRRWVLTLIHEVMTHLGALKLDPSFLSVFQQAVSMGMDAAMKSSRVAAPPRSHVQHAQTGPIPRGPWRTPPAASTAEPITCCFPIDDSHYLEKGWGCHVCATYNGLQRPACRNCGHLRCDLQRPHSPARAAARRERVVRTR